MCLSVANTGGIGPGDCPAADCDNRWLTPLFAGGNASFESISATLDSVAIAVMNRMHVIGKDEVGNPLVAQGQAMETRVCIHVDWLWLPLPGVLVVLAFIVLQ